VNTRPYSMMAIIIFGAFNALLLLVNGLLMALTSLSSGSSGWRIAGAFLLLTLSALIGAAIFGLLLRRVWGRKLLCWGLLFCIPLNFTAIFPILQNHRMTIGNTLLQIVCMTASIAAIFFLARKPEEESSPDRPRVESTPVVQDLSMLDDDRAFTFDRSGFADQLKDH